MAQAVGFVRIDDAMVGMLYQRIGGEAGLNLLAQGLGARRQRRVAILPGKVRHVLELRGGEQIRGHQIAIAASVVAGAEARPGHARVRDWRAAPRVGKRIGGRAVVPLKIVGAFPMPLLGGKYIHDGGERLTECVRIQIGCRILLMIDMRQPNGIAKRIDFVFALPHPRPLFRAVLWPSTRRWVLG